MAMIGADPKSEIGNIQREMARARRQIHEDVGGALTGVQTLTDWRSIIRRHPWLSLGIAAAAGYLVVPRRSAASSVKPLEAQERHDRLISPNAHSASPNPDVGKSVMLSSAIAAIAPVAVRLAQSYALRYLETWIHDHAFPSAPKADSESNRAGGDWTFSAATSQEGSREFPTRS
jgi:hypothetical protein